MPLQEDLAGPADVIGEAAPGGVGGVMANLFQRGASGPHRDAFALGERGNILHHLDQAAIIPHVAESESKKAPFEEGPVRPFLRECITCIMPHCQSTAHCLMRDYSASSHAVVERRGGL